MFQSMVYMSCLNFIIQIGDNHFSTKNIEEHLILNYIIQIQKFVAVFLNFGGQARIAGGGKRNSIHQFPRKDNCMEGIKNVGLAKYCM